LLGGQVYLKQLEVGAYWARGHACNIIIMILCSIDSGNVNAKSTSLSESCHLRPWSLPITISLTDGAMVIFLQSEVENCWHERLSIEPTTLDLCSQSGAYDLSATATPV